VRDPLFAVLRAVLNNLLPRVISKHTNLFIQEISHLHALIAGKVIQDLEGSKFILELM
jgi:hypothetical protein